MRSLRIMSPDFDLQGELAIYTSLRIVRRHFGIGEFELHVPDTTKNVQQVRRDSRLFAIADPRKMLMVEDVLYQEEKKNWVFKGLTLDGLAKYRICVPPSDSDNHFGWDAIADTDAETAFKHFAATQMAQPEDAARTIPRLVIAENQRRGMSGVSWRGRFDKLEQLLKEIGEHTGMGWGIWPDFENEQYVFDVVPGRDLSVGNESATHVIVSLRMRNASSMTHSITTSALRNTAYVGGSGEDENRLILSVGGGFSGLDRRETWVDGGSVDSLVELNMVGQRKLKETAQEVRIEGSVQSSGVFRFGRDWDVGDIVTLQTKTGTVDARVIEATETYETGRPVGISIVAGSAPVTLAESLDRRFGSVVR